MKTYICERWAKKSKEQQGTVLGVPFYGYGMRLYKDRECMELYAIDPWHFIVKDKVMTLEGVPTLVHVVK